MGGKPLFDFPIKPPNGSLQRFDHGQELVKQKAMMRSHAPLQGRNQLLSFVRRPEQGQICQHLRILLASGQGLQDRTSGLAHQIGKNRAQLDIGLLQQLVDAIDVPGALLFEAGA